MKLILGLLVSALPVCVFAQARVAVPTQAAVTWTGPVIGALSMGPAELSRLHEYGSATLPRLATPGVDGFLPLQSSPALLNPLAAELDVLVMAGRRVTPAMFSSMRPEAKVIALAIAADKASLRLGREVAAVTRTLAHGMNSANAEGVSKSAAELREMSLYLNPNEEAQLTAMEKELVAFHAARAETLRSYMEALPSRMAAGAFDGGNLLIREISGDKAVWRFADGKPDQTYPSIHEAVSVRTRSIMGMKPGPWAAVDAKLLGDAVRVQLESGAVGYSDSLVAELSVLEKVREQSQAMVSAVRLTAALPDEGTARHRSVDVLETFYADAHAHAVLTHKKDWRAQARILATIHAGAMDMPGWAQLQAAKIKALDAKARRGMLAGLSGGAALAGGLGALYFGFLGPQAFLAILVGLILLAVSYVHLSALGNQVSPNAANLTLLMRRYFNDK